MDAIDGIRSFEDFRKRSSVIQLGSTQIPVASLADIIKSKKAAARPQDLAVLGLLEQTLEEATRNQERPPRGPQKGK